MKICKPYVQTVTTRYQRIQLCCKVWGGNFCHRPMFFLSEHVIQGSIALQNCIRCFPKCLIMFLQRQYIFAFAHFHASVQRLPLTRKFSLLFFETLEAIDVIHKMYDLKLNRGDIKYLLSDTRRFKGRSGWFSLISIPSLLQAILLEQDEFKCIHGNAMRNALKYGKSGENITKHLCLLILLTLALLKSAQIG